MSQKNTKILLHNDRKVVIIKGVAYQIMGIIYKFGLKALAFFENRNYDIMRLNRGEQEKILNSLVIGRKLDYVTRSFLQYRCQMFFYNESDRFILNIFSVLLLFPFILFAFINYFFVKIYKMRIRESVRISDVAVFMGYDINVVPESLLKKYQVVRSKRSYALGFNTFPFLIKNVYSRFFFHPYFCLKVTLNVAMYNAALIMNSPKAIINTLEYSFTSSILTLFCERNNCYHINVMHGEKLFYIRDAFFSFHRCYVWHEHYVNLFKKLRVNADQFVIELPPKFRLEKKKLNKNPKKSVKIIKYYIGGESLEDLYKLAKKLKEIKSFQDYKVIIRPHPLVSKGNHIYKIFDGFLFESPTSVDIYQSLQESDYVVALYSTVLFHAYILGKSVVVNDLHRMKYLKLKELEFIGVKISHLTLTNLIKHIKSELPYK